jgi:peroxiredoxin
MKLFYICLIACLGLCQISCEKSKEEKAQEQIPIQEKFNTENPAPNFTMQSAEGNAISLSQFKGKVVMIDFWATWCPPCVKSIPEVKNLWKKYKDKGLVILGVSLDKDLQAWQTYIKNNDMTWFQVADGKFWENDAAILYGVESIPNVCIIDQKGNIVAKGLNPMGQSEEIEQTLSTLLENK